MLSQISIGSQKLVEKSEIIRKKNLKDEDFTKRLLK